MQKCTGYGIMTWFCVSKIFGPVGPEKMVICDRSALAERSCRGRCPHRPAPGRLRAGGMGAKSYKPSQSARRADSICPLWGRPLTLLTQSHPPKGEPNPPHLGCGRWATICRPSRAVPGPENENRTDSIRHDDAATVLGNFSQHRTGTPTVYQIGVI